MTFNEQLARNALERIKDNPSHWEQTAWRCGAGMCFAGFVAHEAGARWTSALDYNDDVRTPDGAVIHVQHFAADVLGIDFEEGCELFHGLNSIEILEEIIDQLAEKHNA